MSSFRSALRASGDSAKVVTEAPQETALLKNFLEYLDQYLAFNGHLRHRRCHRRRSDLSGDLMIRHMHRREATRTYVRYAKSIDRQ